MSEADRTPTPVAVDVERIPAARDSNSQFSVEMTEVSSSGAKERRVKGSRKLMHALIFSGAIGGAVIGPHTLDIERDHRQNDTRAALEKVKAEHSAMALSSAQLSALRKFYGDGEKDYDYEPAKEMMDDAVRRAETMNWELPVGQFVSSDQVKINEDGRSFELNGQNYSFARVLEKDGSIYILTARSYKEDNLIRPDKTHMVSPMLVGGARFEEGLNPEELAEKATADTRDRLKSSLEKWKDPVSIAQGPGGKLYVAGVRK